ncbi:IS200/IS605 family transposase [candidate division KSB1 bacterium]|nr:IS200/IS605 family transposase [candidate division KSB1 bacterium]
MPQSLAKVHVHIVFSTKNRQNLINAEVEKALYDYMASICKELKCYVSKINGTENHVHIACCLSRTVTIATLLEEVKRSSSKWIKTKGRAYKNFTWQIGYGAFSFGESQLQDVVRFINDQKEYHKKVTFEDEFRGLLKKYNIEYDERYVWD